MFNLGRLNNLADGLGLEPGVIAAVANELDIDPSLHVQELEHWPADPSKKPRDVINLLGAWRRIQNGDPDDRFYALIDFQKGVEAFVSLFEAHAVRENDQMYPTAGGFFNDSDDALVLNIIQHSGSPDITPYIGMVERMEKLLGIGA